MARGNSASQMVVMRFLSQLGPGGSLIRSLIEPSQPGPRAQRQLRQAAALLRAFGHEVLPGTNATVADITSGIEASISNLQRRGMKWPGPASRSTRGCIRLLPSANRRPCESTASTIRLPCFVSTSRSSNRTGGFPASGSPTGFTVKPTIARGATFA